MCRWPVLHMVILMVIVCTSLLFQVLHFILDVIFHRIHIHSCFFYWTIMDIYVLFLPFYLLLGYYLQSNTLDVEFNVLGKNFVILLMVCIIYECICYFHFPFSFMILCRLGGNVVFTLIVLTLYTSHFALYLLFSHSHYLLSMPLKNHVYVL